MVGRRSLSNALQTVPNADPQAVRAFVTQGSDPARVPSAEATPTAAVAALFQPVGLIPITVRLRPEIAGALKRASLERQLAAAEYFSQQEIVERALTAWMQQNGHPI